MDKTNYLLEKVAQIESELQSQAQINLDTTTTLKTTEDNMSNLQDKNNLLEEKITSLEEQSSTQGSTLENTISRVTEVENKATTLSSTVDELSTKVDTNVDNISTLSNQLDTTMTQLNSTSQQLTSLSSEVKPAITTNSADIATLTSDLEQETSDRTTADLYLQNDITNISSDLSAETTARQSADTTLQKNINSEASARVSADTTIQENIDEINDNLTAETTARQTADTTLQKNIDNEASARTSADSNLQNQITTNTNNIANKVDTSQIVQTTGTSTTNILSQKATTDLLDKKINSSQVVQETGTSTTNIMSQNATTTSLSNKVDKVDGKGLSSNDFTDTYKNKIDTNYDKIGAMTTKVSGLSSTVENLESGKVDKVDGKTLSTNDFTNEYKSQIDTNKTNIESNDNKIGGLTSITSTHTTKISSLETDMANKLEASNIKAGSNITVSTNGNNVTINSVASDQIQSDWNQSDSTATDYIKNKPTIPENFDFTLAGLSERSYNSLTDKPDIPEGGKLYSTTGTNIDGAMTQQAVTTELESKVPSSAIVQNLGISTTNIMSQYAVTQWFQGIEWFYKTLYLYNASSSDLNWGYTSGIKDGVTVSKSGIFNNNKYYGINCYIKRGTETYKVFVSLRYKPTTGTNYCGSMVGLSSAVDNYICSICTVNSSKNQLTVKFRTGKTSWSADSTSYIYLIEGVYR